MPSRTSASLSMHRTGSPSNPEKTCRLAGAAGRAAGSARPRGTRTLKIVPRPGSDLKLTG